GPGIEPGRGCPRGILSPLRLPVSPPRHTGYVLNLIPLYWPRQFAAPTRASTLRSSKQHPQILDRQLPQEARVIREHRRGQVALTSLQLLDLLLDRVLAEEPVCEDAPRLPDPVRAVDRLGFDGRV